MTKLSPYIVVLKALNVGLTVKLGSHLWEMVQCGDGKRRVFCRMWNETKNEVHYVNTEITLNSFLNLCGELTEEELFSLSANTALNDKGSHVRSAMR